MTTIGTAAAWRVRSFAFAAAASLLSITLGGCETASNLFGSSGDAAAPTAEALPPAGQQQTAKVAVASVIGPSESVARQLESQIASSLARQNVSVARAPTDKAEYTLRGYLVSAREKSGTKISHVWDVTDPTGKRVNRITGEEVVPGAQGKDPWSAVTPQLVDQIANKTAGSLVAWLPTQQSSQPVPPLTPAASPVPVATTPMAAPPAPVASAPPPAAPTLAAVPQQSNAGGPTTTASISREAVIVPSVTGAPGDGSVSLTNAIQQELKKNGVALANQPSNQAYRVEGKVVVGQGKDGKQPISIDWDVKDPKGKKLGTVSQKNEIPQGSVDGPWGKTADNAAAAAAQGIVKLLPAQTRTN